MLNREDNENLEDFWPKGNKCPIMFVDVVGEEGQDIGSSKREAKVGVDSKYNGKEVKLVVRENNFWCSLIMIFSFRLKSSGFFTSSTGYP